MAETPRQREQRLEQAAIELARMRERRHSWQTARAAYLRAHPDTHPNTLAAIERRAYTEYQIIRDRNISEGRRRARLTRAERAAAAGRDVALAAGVTQIIYPGGGRYHYPDDYSGVYITFRDPRTGLPTTVEYWAPLSGEPERRLHEIAGGMLSTEEGRRQDYEEFRDIYFQIVSGAATVYSIGSAGR